MKKGQSISINTIIIAAIALAVLVVLFMIFTGRMGGFVKGLTETDTCAQKCDSLNLKMTKTLDAQTDSCEGTKVAGQYKDGGKWGCCCTT